MKQGANAPDTQTTIAVKQDKPDALIAALELNQGRVVADEYGVPLAGYQHYKLARQA